MMFLDVFKRHDDFPLGPALGGEIPAEGGDGDRECVTPAPLLPMYFPIGSS